ncbi:hypothetical protein Tco_1350280 [Tanacetum coccineum]
MPEDSRVPIILGRPFLAIARAMIDVFNKNITLRVGDDEVIFDVDQSIKRPTTEDNECYGIDDLDNTINEEAQELLANEEPDSFLSRGMEKLIDQSDLKCCESASSNENDGSDSETRYGVSTLLIRHSLWDSSIHVVPKKEGMTVVTSLGSNALRLRLFGASLRAWNRDPRENLAIRALLPEQCSSFYVLLLPLGEQKTTLSDY